MRHVKTSFAISGVSITFLAAIAILFLSANTLPGYVLATVFFMLACYEGSGYAENYGCTIAGNPCQLSRRSRESCIVVKRGIINV